jgi:allantoate deiminase
MPDRAARRVIERCHRLAGYSEEAGCTTRTFLSPPMRAVHRELTTWMTQAGMTVSVDAVGNIRGVYPGSAADVRRFYIGSHLDSVPRAGAFDGVLGVLAGVALVEMLAPRRLPFAIEVVGFSEEEGVRFGVPFIGSRALAGTVDDALLARHDAGGASVRDAIAGFGLDCSRIGEARAADTGVGYLEVHIEQGPVLDARSLPLGVVEGIVGLRRAALTFTGVSGHAGTTPMAGRADALAAAAEWLVAVEQEATGTVGLVATAGHISVAPGAANVIPGECRVTLDLRHAEDAVRLAAVERLRAKAANAASRRGVALRWDVRLDQAATPLDPMLTSLLARAVATLGVEPFHMSSGAGHDAMILAPHMPAAMLFIRSPRGISHHPDESVHEDDIDRALAAGVAFLDLLAESTGG